MNKEELKELFKENYRLLNIYTKYTDGRGWQILDILVSIILMIIIVTPFLNTPYINIAGGIAFITMIWYLEFPFFKNYYNFYNWKSGRLAWHKHNKILFKVLKQIDQTRLGE